MLELYFTKAALHSDGTRHWSATVSDTLPDNHGERVDEVFFLNAVEQSDVYGLPHLCVSHYDFTGKNVPESVWKAGITSAMFLDGERFKAKGQFFDNDIGKALFNAVRQDMENGTPYEERVRISMGFYDRTRAEEKSETTEDGDERRVYKAGIIKHFAGTRVPVLPRTEIEAWKEMSMISKRTDAEAIVGEELAEELESLAKEVGKSETELEEELVVKADDEELTEMAKKKKKKKGQPEKVDKDYVYTEQPRGPGGTMAEEMWTETGEEAEYPGMDEATKKKNEEERKRIKKTSKRKKSETEEEVVEQMIKEEDGKVVLYSKDGTKVLGNFEYGEGKKYKDKNAARAAAHKQEGIVKAIKEGKFRKGKSETEEKCEVVGGTEVEDEEVEEQSETVEKAGRRLRGKKIEEFRSMLDQMKQIIETGDTFLKWAEQTPEAITNTSTGVDMPIENPAIAILEQGAPATMVYEADFDDKMADCVENIYNGVTEGNLGTIQSSLNGLAEAIKAELEPSVLEDVSKAENEEEVTVKAEDVELPVTPLDAFNMKTKAVLGSEELDRRGKLAALQDAVNETATWLQKSVIEGTPPSMGDIREVIIAAVEKGTQPLLQENATLKARLDELERKVDQTGPPQAPVRKSAYSSQGVPPKLENGTFTAAEVARRTMPQGVYY